MSSTLSLFHPEAYRRALEKLRAKLKERGRGREPESEGVSLSGLWGAEAELCRAIAAEVASGSYSFGPLRRTEAHIDGKWRTLHRPDLLDALVLGALSARLTGLLESVLSDNVYAYRPGRSAMLAVSRLQDHLAEHRRRHTLKTRGVFVLQRDLSNYGESIPTADDSALWGALSAVLGRVEDPSEATVMKQLLDAACRPEVLLPNGQTLLMDHGLPTGSPIQQPLANLYLAALDQQLAQESVFYSRFGDDLLVVCEGLDLAQKVASRMRRGVEGLALTFNRSKTRNQYFTKPGRPFGQPSAIGWAPTSHIEYLGVRLNFDGRLGLRTKRVRQLLLRSRLRVANTIGVSPPELAPSWVVSVLEQALTESGSMAEPLREALTTWVDDRDQLRQIDYQLLLLCAEALSGKRGVRAFRQVSPAALRRGGLSSLVQLKRRGKGKA